jgi:hypothetical protein
LNSRATATSASEQTWDAWAGASHRGPGLLLFILLMAVRMKGLAKEPIGAAAGISMTNRVQLVLVLLQ